MNTNYKMTRENLELAKAARVEAWKAARAEIEPQVKEIVGAACVNGYTLDSIGVDFDYFTLRNHGDGERRMEIELYYRRPWVSEDRRKVELNVCAVGSFDSTKTEYVAYYSAVGSIAGRLGEITDKLNAIAEWNKFDEARRNIAYVEDEIMRLDRAEKEREQKERLEKVMSKLAVGRVIVMGVKWHHDWDNGGARSFDGLLKNKVERMTKKLIWFEGKYAQYRIDDVAKYLVRGVKDGGWSFADEVDEKDFAV